MNAFCETYRCEQFQQFSILARLLLAVLSYVCIHMHGDLWCFEEAGKLLYNLTFTIRCFAYTKSRNVNTVFFYYEILQRLLVTIMRQLQVKTTSKYDQKFLFSDFDCSFIFIESLETRQIIIEKKICMRICLMLVFFLLL